MKWWIADEPLSFQVLTTILDRELKEPPSMSTHPSLELEHEIATDYDAILIVSFGGPEKPDDVMPFLENVLRGRNVPRERMLEVAEHYYHFGGVSPLNQQVRDLIAALRPELDRRGVALPIYWGNRNWHPLLPDALDQMVDRGAKKALAVVVSAYSSYSGCRQYRENLESARQTIGENAPVIHKMRVFYNHPLFIEANADCVRDALARVPEDRRDRVHLAFTAHSIPRGMSENCNYVKQLSETCRLLAESLGIAEDRTGLVYQSRSGRPSDPWLEPDILDHVNALHEQGVTDLVIHPVGFLSDHMEVLFDLDEEAQRRCDSLGMRMVRSATVGTHPLFIEMMGELIEERITGSKERRSIGLLGPSHDVCPLDCCLLGAAAAGRPLPPSGR